MLTNCRYVQFAATLLMAISSTIAFSQDTRESKVAFSISGTIVNIEDGDTVTLKHSNGKSFGIRMSDMDTPETSHGAQRPGQPGGQAAKKSLAEFVAVGDAANVECYAIESYGRAVCHLFVKGVNLNLEQIKRGWGWLPKTVGWIRDPDSKAAEAEAKAAKRGAWGLPDQMTPADWRTKCWKESTCPGAEP